ncbi:S-adenosyl-L-methionine-dependent methyltransferase [Calycina marina]|uniref:S-adenosyl-L-methionine-dependent methyltransferase n=1 Tax=Calycina marina TaxID=1763456 RepID=A0A9P7ZB71_9HELO|nr:S-adenosyl-L-methionine-dependent methyltransferase [Calycina marina]
METICRREMYMSLRARGGIPSPGELRVWSRAFSRTSAKAAKSRSKPSKKSQKAAKPSSSLSIIKPYASNTSKPDTRLPSIDSSSPPIAAPEPKTPLNPLLDRYRRTPLIGMGIMAFVISGYVGFFYTNLKNTPGGEDAPKDASAQPDVSVRYDEIARKFDASVEYEEIAMRLPAKRKDMVSQAHGHILEVSVGTGRNLEYYDWDFDGYKDVGKRIPGKPVNRGSVKSLTAVDISPEMVEVAKEKFARKFPGMPQPRWVVADASKDIPSPPSGPDKKYDAIIQTMGLCSVHDPVALLKNLGNHVKEDGGRILLLEHGRGTWRAVNWALDKQAVGHALEHGCWWNRDIEAIVEESGLEVVNYDTYFFGTTWCLELRKPKSPITEKTTPSLSLSTILPTEEAKKSWWPLW